MASLDVDLSEEAKSARIQFDQASEQNDWHTAKVAFEALQKETARIASAFESLCDMYGRKIGGKPDGDVGAVERIATEAIKLAQQVIAREDRP